MNLINLCRAEWLKLQYHKLNFVLLITSIAILLIVLGAFVIQPLHNQPSRQGFIDTLSFPASIDFGFGIVKKLSTLLIPLIVSNAIGLEQTADTWKMILPRTDHRYSVLASKLAVVSLMLIAWATLLVLLTVLVGVIGSISVRSPISVVPDTGFFRQLTGHCFQLMAEGACYGALTVCVTVLFKSAATGAAISVLLPLVFSLGSYLGPVYIALLLPTVHLENLFAEPSNAKLVALLASHQVPALLSLAVIAIYILVSLGIAFYAFEKRDFAGE